MRYLFVYVRFFSYLCTLFVKNIFFTMNTLIKYLGVILVLLGVVCLVIYHFALPQNWLLVLALVLEVGGILGYIFINKKID